MRRTSKSNPVRLHECSLPQLCNFVVTCSRAYEDVAEHIEEKAYELCSKGKSDKAIEHLAKLVSFYETMEAKNEETLRDLSMIYVLLGELLQMEDRHAESIEWFQKALVSDERQTLPYQSLARSYAAMGEIDRAIRSLEQEIRLSPGNYFSYLLLAQLYEKRGQDHEMEECLERLLVRDPENVQGLHLLIAHHQRRHPGLDIELLRRRLIAVSRKLDQKDLAIWVYHMCAEGKVAMCDRMLEARTDDDVPLDPALYLLLAHVKMLQGDTKSAQVSLECLVEGFRNRAQALERKLSDFVAVFGETCLEPIRQRLEKIQLEPAN